MAVVTKKRSLFKCSTKVYYLFSSLARIKWCGGYINWYHPMRIKHITSGMYLGVDENNSLMLIRREDANLANSCFYLR